MMVSYDTKRNITVNDIIYVKLKLNTRYTCVETMNY